MLEKKVKYEDYNGEEVEGVFRFHLTKPEVLNWVYGKDGGATFPNTLKVLMEKDDTNAMMKAFEDLLLKSYGERTGDGRFEKSPEIAARFKSSAAYPEIYMEIAESAEATIEFLQGIMPKDYAEAIKEASANGAVSLPPEMQSLLPVK